VNAQHFIGDADGPDLVISKADDGTPLPDCRGWYCDWCGTLYVGRDDAELCCTSPDVADKPIVVGTGGGDEFPF
jgi:hypothetical protein